MNTNKDSQTSLTQQRDLHAEQQPCLLRHSYFMALFIKQHFWHFLTTFALLPWFLCLKMSCFSTWKLVIDWDCKCSTNGASELVIPWVFSCEQVITREHRANPIHLALNGRLRSTQVKHCRSDTEIQSKFLFVISNKEKKMFNNLLSVMDFSLCKIVFVYFWK